MGCKWANIVAENEWCQLKVYAKFGVEIYVTAHLKG